MNPFFARNHYEMLQVGRNATSDEVTRAFRKLAKKYHPDVAQQQLIAATTFHRIRESYEVLSDPVKRREYDQRLKVSRPMGGAGVKPPPSRTPSRGAAARTRSTAWRAASKPKAKPLRHSSSLDVEASISVNLNRIFTGGEQTVYLDKAPQANHPLRSRAVRVTIPPMCVEGSVIEVPLFGRHNQQLGQAGNLKLRVEYAAQDGFQIRGPHLYTSIMIYPWDAAMGATIPIDSPEGETSFNVPAGTHQWKTFCMQEKGLPQKDGNRGNLYIYVKIKSVAVGSERQLALWKALKESYEGSDTAS